MNEIVLRNPPTAGSVATDLLESVIVVLMVWKAWPNRLVFLLALCAGAALLLYRIRRYDYSIVITPTCVRRQRRYGKAEVIPLSDYEGVGVGAIQQTGYRPGHLAQTALIPRDKFAQAQIVFETPCRFTRPPLRHEASEQLAQQIAALTGLKNHGILGMLTGSGDWYYLAHRRPGAPDLFGLHHDEAPPQSGK